MATASGEYQFSAEPRRVTDRRTRYRKPEEPKSNQNANIMHDKRVVRGNTFAAMVIPANSQQEIDRQNELEQRRRRRLRERQREAEQDEHKESSTPEPVEGRLHIDAQTDNLMDEEPDKPPEKEAEAQTDYVPDEFVAFMNFNPYPNGESVETQVEDGELFNFNVDVKPLLDVLVGQTLEHSRMEVLEEEELEAMRRHQREFEHKWNEELIAVQRLEAEEVRRHQEAERRKLQAKTKKEQMIFSHQKFTCRVLAKEYLSALLPNTLGILEELGIFRDRREIPFNDKVIGTLVKSIKQGEAQDQNMRKVIEQFLTISHENLAKNHLKSVRAEYNRREAARLAGLRHQEEEKQRKERRREQRIVRQIERERQALRIRFENEVIANCEFKENMTYHGFSDFDGRNPDAIVGTPGGLFVEFLQFLQVFEQMHNTNLTDDQVKLLLRDYLQTGMKSPKFVFANLHIEQFNEFLATFEDPDLSSDNLFGASDDIKNAVFAYVTDVNNAFPGTTLTDIWQNEEVYKFRHGLVRQLILAFFKFYTAKNDDKGNPNPLRMKTSLKLLDYEPQRTEQAVLRIRIPLRYPEPEDRSDAEQVEKEDVPQEPVEIEDLANHVMLVPPTKEDLSAFVIHQAAPRFLRHELATFSKVSKEFDHLDIESLKEKLIARASELETLAISRLAPELPIFDFEIN